MAIIDFEFTRLEREIQGITIQKLKDVLFDFGLELESYDASTDLVKIDVTAERLDLLSFEGFLKAIKTYLGLQKYKPLQAQCSNQKVFVHKSVFDYGNFTMCAIVKNLTLSNQKIKDLISIQEKLHLTYGKKRKSVAIGVYPLDKISFPITFLALPLDEIFFTPLDFKEKLNGKQILTQHPTGKEFQHLLEGKKSCLIFKDANNNILSMPPIINSQETGRVTPETRDLFIECTGSNLTKLKNTINLFINIFSEMQAEVYTLEIVYPHTTIISPDLSERKINLSLKSINSLLGTNLSLQEAKNSLERLMLNSVVLPNNSLEVTIPSFRFDILHENDVIDDVMRGYTLKNIAPTFNVSYTVSEKMDITFLQEDISLCMVGMGFIEVYVFLLSSFKENFENFFLKPENFIPLGMSVESSVNLIQNWLTPKLFKTLKVNQHRSYPQKLFACDYVVIENKNKNELSENQLRLAVLIANSRVSFTEICSNLLALTNFFNKKLCLKEKHFPFYIKGRSASIFIDDKEVGHIGEFSPEVLENHNFTMPVCGFEIQAEVLK